MVASELAPDRIVVRLPGCGSTKLHHQLEAFARYCIARLERALGPRGAWTVTIAAAPGGYASHVIVRDHGTMVEADGTGRDRPLAVWAATCRIEERLREPQP